MTVAIVIASYNRKSTLLQAVRSALDLIIPVGIERYVIVIDDGSTDQSFESLLGNSALLLTEKEKDNFEKMATSPLNLTVLRCKNGERGLARNHAAEWSQKNISPDWFLFLDSDDCLVETALMRFAQAIEQNKKNLPVLFYSWYALWDGHNSPTQMRQKFTHTSQGDLSIKVLNQTFIPLGASLISASAFFSVGQFPIDRALSGSEDKILITRLAFAGRIDFCPQVAVWYRQHAGNTDRNSMLKSIELTESELIPDIEKKFGQQTQTILKKFRRHSFLKMIGYSIFNRDFKYAFSLFFKGAFNNISILLDWSYWKMLLIFGVHFLKSLFSRTAQ